MGVLSQLPTLATIVVGVPLSVYFYKCLVMTLFQRRVIYVSYLPPNARQPAPLAEVLTRTYRSSLQGEEIVIPREKGSFIRLQGYTFQRKKTTAASATAVATSSASPIIIYFQGNAGNMLQRIPVFERILAQLPLTSRIVAIHTRGYGGSNGRPTQPGLREDALRILDYTMKRYVDRETPIFVYGHSIGGAVALHLALDAARHYTPSPIRGLILENTFTSMEALVGAVFPRWMPLLLSGSKDELVPVSMMQQLAQTIEATPHAPRPIFKAFPYGLHENTFLQPGYSQTIAHFIEDNAINDHHCLDSCNNKIS
ncbi:Alpha/Beta hydrolase protein [Syncephalis plumigaleata]|nr:Alpha/Beta hydrolase protein [Syncephalis plumigaleata]